MSISITSLVELLGTSKLLDEEQLARVERAASQTDDPKELLRALIQRRYISRWQGSQLLAGRNAFFFGKYKIRDLLGRGHLGNVFLAEHVTMNRPVVLRAISRALVSDAESLERFLSHARTIASLDHPNLVHAFNADKEGDRYYLVMEYVDGQDLEHLVQARGPLDCGCAANYIRQAAEGLAYVHSLHLIHYDIRPANLMITRQGVVKLQDLGLDRLAAGRAARADSRGEAGGAAARSDAGVYRAPEVLSPAAEPDHRADIYSLGVTFYFALTAKPPQEGKLPADPCEIRGEIPREMSEICTRMMAADPAERFQAAEEVVQLLSPWQAPPAPLATDAESDASLTVAAGDDDDDTLRIGDITLGRARRTISKPSTRPGVTKRKSGSKTVAPNETLCRIKEAWSQHRRSIIVGSLAGTLVVLLALAGLWLGGVFSHRSSDPASRAQTATAANPAEADLTAEAPSAETLASVGSARWDEILTADLEPAAEKPPVTAASKVAAAIKKPEEPSAEMVAAPPAASPAEEKSSEGPAEKPAEPSSEKPPEKPAEKAAEKAAEKPDQPPAAPPKPVNPFADLPARVSLPELNSKPEALSSFSIGPIRAVGDAPLELALLGGETALRSSGRHVRAFVLRQKPPATAESEWIVAYSEETKGLEQKNVADVARFFREGGVLKFQWVEGADDSVANYLRNCVLQLRLGEASHLMPLTTPEVVKPLVIDLVRGGGNESIAVRWLPESERLRIAVTKIEGRDGSRVDPVAPAPPKTPLKLSFARDDGTGQATEAVTLRLVFTPRAAAIDARLQLVAPTTFRPFQGQPTNVLRVQAQGNLEKVKKELEQQEKNKSKDWQRRTLMAAQQRLIEQNLWLIDFYEQVHEKARVHFNISTEVSGYDKPLVLVETSDAPPADFEAAAEAR